GSISNYLFQYDNNTAFSSPGTLCDGASNKCTWNTSLQQTQCENNSMSCYIRVVVTDDNGLTNSTYILVGIDTQGPTVTLGLPEDNENITTDSYNVDASAVDDESGVDIVFFQYRENNSASWKDACNDSTVTYQCSWDTSTLNDGNTYEFRAYAIDNNGNTGNYNVHTGITIDRTAPSITLENPPNDNYTSETTIIFYYNVNDTTSDVSNCSIIINGTINDTKTVIQEDVSQNFTLTLSEGYYVWKVNCTDVHGFTNTSFTRNFTIDTTGPTSVLDRPPNNENISGATYTVNASVTDSGIGSIDTVIFEYRKGAAAWSLACTNSSSATSSYACDWTVSGLADGDDYEVRVYANDTLGTNGTPDSHTSIRIDNNGPAIVLLSPGPGATDGDGDVVFEFSVTDTVFGIANCSLYINGNLNDSIYAPIAQGETLSFTVFNMTNGNYDWNITCWDDFPSPHQNWSATRSLTIDIRYTMNVLVNTSKQQYEVGNQMGETLNVTTNTTDYYNNSLDTNVKTDIIYGDTIYPWWNTSWKNRRPIYVTELSGQDRNNVIVEADVSGLGGYISSCTNEIRVISINLTEVSVNIIGGDDSTYCNFVFKANVSASASSRELYFVYFNNSAAGDPGYPILKGKYYGMFLDDFNIGTQPDPAKWTETGGAWNIEGQRAHADNTKSYHLITTIANLIDMSVYSHANVTFDWEVAAGEMEAADCLRLDLYDGSWHDGIWQKCDDIAPVSGSANVYGGSGYMLSSFQLRFGADTDTSAEQVWVDNVYVDAYRLIDFNISAATGNIQEHISRNQSDTGIDGLLTFLWRNASWAIGNYSAVSLATKALYYDTYDNKPFEIIPDQTPPNITLHNPPNGSDANSSVTFAYVVNDTFSSIKNCTLIIDGVEDDNDTIIDEGPNQYFYPRLPKAGWHNWSINCTDFYGNTGASKTWKVWIRPPDLTVTSSDITFTYDALVEGKAVNISATIFNIGGSDAKNALIELYLGNPDFGGAELDNFTANITDPTGDHSNYTVNYSWIITGPGPFNFFVLTDPPLATNGSIFEINETNNKANKTLDVSGYTVIYGNVTSRYALFTNFSSLEFGDWGNASGGNVLVIQSDAVISFSTLQAMSRDTSDVFQSSDFNDIDLALSMENFSDSINITYTSAGSPKKTASFTIYEQTIGDVPVINSTDNANFVTGILWDYSDGGPQYNGLQDLVFITKVNESKVGAYGTYDYELKFPTLLRTYKDGGSGTVSYYYEIT
ncbi:MAG: Ig-like domain-containing protein, partial [archaeon]